MAVLIDHTNYDMYLKRSTQGRAGSPDGNVYFDTANGKIELISVEELATFDHTPMGGGASDPNQLTNADGITMRALYLFESQEREADETLRNFKRGTGGKYKGAGAYSFINGVKLDSTVDDRKKIRSSGFVEYLDAGYDDTMIDRIYHGITSVSHVDAGAAPYYVFAADDAEATLQAATTWAEFNRSGEVDEVVQVFGTTANGDTGAGDFDYTDDLLIVRLRTWGNLFDQATSDLSKIKKFDGFKGGYGIRDRVNPKNTFTLADVYGGAQVSPWTGMSLEKLATPQTETGFNEADGDFTWVLHNTEGGTAQECAAYLDALAMQDADIDVGTGTYNGWKGREWHICNDDEKVQTVSLSGEGLFIEGLTTAEKQNVVLTDDAGNTKTYPFYPDVQINVGAAAKADANAWYHVYYVDGAAGADFDTAGAVVVNDASGNPVKGACSTADANNIISFAYDYDNNTQAGLSAGVDKDVVVEVESYGSSSVEPKITYFTITRDAVVSADCDPPTDPNA